MNSKALSTYLLQLRNGVYKLLPMRECKDKGEDNHLNEYLDRLIEDTTAAQKVFPTLAESTNYINVIVILNALQSQSCNDFNVWRTKVLKATRLVAEMNADSSARK